ncbi:MAG TPA: ABC transporter permease [Actinomycetota bacterium]|nr:ABC transporter permease [Actinomycetota bacterium]
MSAVALTLRQFGYENKAFWRNPAAAFFTFGFPIMFLVIFNGLFSEDTEFYVPAIGAFAVISACFTNVAMGVTIARDQGVLKRVRGTPMPAVSYLVGRVLHAIFIAAILVAITVIAGAVLYDVNAPSNLGRFLPTLVIGAATFCTLGLAITSLIPNEEAAPAIVNAAVLPLSFISDIFVDSTEAPRWLQTVADIFPIKHFAQAMSASFDPTFREWSGTDLVVLAIWGVVGLLLAARFFSWEPRR